PDLIGMGEVRFLPSSREEPAMKIAGFFIDVSEKNPIKYNTGIMQNCIIPVYYVKRRTYYLISTIFCVAV
ncbi:MAG: hypothetical protein L0Y76_10540, partial [Ignavibacteria bacterium]|nr:hypothetical protein [Ignavibacteria bacterium]